MENSGTRSTRVVFHNNIVCDVFNVNSSSHQKCRDNITSYTEEEFVPSGVPSIDHLTFQIQRNEAVPDVIPSRLLPIPASHTTPTKIEQHILKELEQTKRDFIIMRELKELYGIINGHKKIQEIMLHLKKKELMIVLMLMKMMTFLEH